MSDRTNLKRWGRWLATFVGFPLAGVTARALAGDIDSATAAAIGGLGGGAVLGAVQAGIGGIGGIGRGSGTGRAGGIRWTAGSAVGLAAGLALGAAAVGYRTDPASLAVMGAFSGAGVGLAQALSVPMTKSDRVLWAAATPVLWAAGWLVTSQVIVDADSHHAVFGSSGALLVSALAGLLHARRQRSAAAATAGVTPSAPFAPSAGSADSASSAVAS